MKVILLRRSAFESCWFTLRSRIAPPRFTRNRVHCWHGSPASSRSRRTSCPRTLASTAAVLLTSVRCAWLLSRFLSNDTPNVRFTESAALMQSGSSWPAPAGSRRDATPGMRYSSTAGSTSTSTGSRPVDDHRRCNGGDSVAFPPLGRTIISSPRVRTASDGWQSYSATAVEYSLGVCMEISYLSPTNRPKCSTNWTTKSL
jgi:hypothetical protein